MRTSIRRDMKRNLLIVSGLFVIIELTGLALALANSAECTNKTDYNPPIKCANSTVVVHNDSQLDTYLNDFGFNGNKYQDLKVSFDVNRPNIEIHSPCKIKFSKDVQLTGDTICLDGREGIVDGNGYAVDANEFIVCLQTK